MSNPSVTKLMIVLALASRAHAGVLFTNIDLGLTLPAQGYQLGQNAPPGVSKNIVFGVQFSPWSSGTFGDVILAIPMKAGVVFTILLDADAGGQPGAILEQINFTGSGAVDLNTVPSTLRPSLIAGTSYWLIAADLSTDWRDATFWRMNNTGDSSSDSNMVVGFSLTPSLPYGAGFLRPAFQIDEPAVPEPSSVVLCASAFVAVGLGHKQRR